MKLSSKISLVSISVLTLILSLLFFACSSPTQPLTSSNEATVPPGTISSSDNPSTQTQDTVPVSPDRVDVVYFHRPQRCPSCLCFEERIRYVVATYFQSEINAGKMTFGVHDIGDSKNTEIVNKYGAVGSQLFINIVRNNKDNIEDIQDIWSWNCRNNKPGFDQQVKNVIEQSLSGEE